MLRFARPMAFLIAAVAGLIASGQPPAPPAKLTPEQQEKLKTRDRLGSESEKLQREGKLAEARAAGAKCLTIERDLFGDNHPDVAESLEWLTSLCVQLEDFPAARGYGREALAARKKLHGGSHWKTTDARLALADVEFRAGLSEDRRADLDEADRLTRELPRRHDRGEYQKAAEAAEKTLSLRRAVLGDKHPHYADGLHNLALVYKAQRLFAKAEPLLKEALAIRKEVLGEKHPRYAVSLNSLAVLYYSKGLFAKAEPLYREALAVRKATVGNKHPDYAVSLDDLALAYYDQNLFAKAAGLPDHVWSLNE